MSYLDTANALQVVRGATRTYDLAISADTPGAVDTGPPSDLTGARLLLSVKRERTDPAPLFVKDSAAPPSGIVITDARGGLATVTFAPADTQNLDPGFYLYDLWVVFADASRVPVIPESTLEVLSSITRIPL